MQLSVISFNACNEYQKHANKQHIIFEEYEKPAENINLKLNLGDLCKTSSAGTMLRLL